jgi:HEAT repeat protein
VIVDLFSVRNESLQLAVVESLSRYRNYQSMLALFRLTKSKNNVSFLVKMSATNFLTRLVGKRMIPFLLESLEDPDLRMRANAIESIGLLKDRKTLSILVPYLKVENHRIRANAAVALYPFRRTRRQALACLETLFRSKEKVHHLASLFAFGELKLRQYEKDLIRLLPRIKRCSSTRAPP